MSLLVALFAAAIAAGGPVQDKNFYVLSLLETSSAVATDAELKTLRDARAAALHQAAATCALDAACFAGAMRFSDAEMTQAAAALRRLYRSSEQVRRMTDGPLRRSRRYVLHRSVAGDELLAAAWLESAAGINNILDTYGSGKPPRYPQIDAVSFDVQSRAYGQLVHTVGEDLDEQAPSLRRFFEPSLRFALYLLQINDRDEAGRFEPLQTGENAAAVRRLRGIRWGDYPYSAIIVPGYGPELAGWSLAPQGRLRVEIAARRFQSGKAPLIIVSGGYVHPGQTPYCEAMEMKKSLIRDYRVPADAIVIEPHARHTTTNLRNAARLIYRYGIPSRRTALIVTDSFHSAYIGGDDFAKRCEQELRYQPGTIGARRSAFDLEFTPRIESLQSNPMDPLDP